MGAVDIHIVQAHVVSSSWIALLVPRQGSTKPLFIWELWNSGLSCLALQYGQFSSESFHYWLFLRDLGTSLVVQWLRIHLLMQGTRVRALVWEDPTCRGATKPVRHNLCSRAREPQLLKPVHLEPMHLEPVPRSKRSHCSEKPMHRNEE